MLSLHLFKFWYPDIMHYLHPDCSCKICFKTCQFNILAPVKNALTQP